MRSAIDTTTRRATCRVGTQAAQIAQHRHPRTAGKGERGGTLTAAPQLRGTSKARCANWPDHQRLSLFAIGGNSTQTRSVAGNTILRRVARHLLPSLLSHPVIQSSSNHPSGLDLAYNGKSIAEHSTTQTCALQVLGIPGKIRRTTPPCSYLSWPCRWRGISASSVRLNPDANDGDQKTPAGVTDLHMSSWLAQDKYSEVDMSTYGRQYPSSTMKYIITRHYATQSISAPHIGLLGGS
jgi:hypothetical protein